VVWQDARRVWDLADDGWLLAQSKCFLRQSYTGTRG